MAATQAGPDNRLSAAATGAPSRSVRDAAGSQLSEPRRGAVPGPGGPAAGRRGRRLPGLRRSGGSPVLPGVGRVSDALPPVGRAAASPFVAASGFEPGEISGTRVTGSAELGPDQHTPWGVVHGGVYCAIIESAASIGASIAVTERGQFAVG